MRAADRFTAAYDRALTPYTYAWTPGKEASAQWIADRIGRGSVLDIGGTTRLLDILHERGQAVSYFDRYPPPEARPYPVHVGDLHSVADNFLPQSFDWVVMRHTLEHSLNPLLVLWQIAELLTDGGHAVIVVPNYCRDWVRFWTHFSVLPVESWLMLFHRAGFGVVEHTDGYWDDSQSDPHFIEHRFILTLQTRDLRLT